MPTHLHFGKFSYMSGTKVLPSSSVSLKHLVLHSIIQGPSLKTLISSVLINFSFFVISISSILLSPYLFTFSLEIWLFPCLFSANISWGGEQQEMILHWPLWFSTLSFFCCIFFIHTHTNFIKSPPRLMRIMDTTLHLRQWQNMTSELETKKRCRLVAL